MDTKMMPGAPIVQARRHPTDAKGPAPGRPFRNRCLHGLLNGYLDLLGLRLGDLRQEHREHAVCVTALGGGISCQMCTLIGHGWGRTGS